VLWSQGNATGTEAASICIAQPTNMSFKGLELRVLDTLATKSRHASWARADPVPHTCCLHCTNSRLQSRGLSRRHSRTWRTAQPNMAQEACPAKKSNDGTSLTDLLSEKSRTLEALAPFPDCTLEFFKRDERRGSPLQSGWPGPVFCSQVCRLDRCCLLPLCLPFIHTSQAYARTRAAIQKTLPVCSAYRSGPTELLASSGTLFDTSLPVMMGSLCACVCRNMLIDMPDERSIMLPESLVDIAVLPDSIHDEQYLCMLKAHWLSEP